MTRLGIIFVNQSNLVRKKSEVHLIFIFYKNKFDSNILDNDSKKKLSELCQFPNGQKWRLLYRATRDGFGAKDFHRECDHFENTLVNRLKAMFLVDLHQSRGTLVHLKKFFIIYK
jgi:hypothetical protein